MSYMHVQVLINGSAAVLSCCQSIGKHPGHLTSLDINADEAEWQDKAEPLVKELAAPTQFDLIPAEDTAFGVKRVVLCFSRVNRGCLRIWLTKRSPDGSKVIHSNHHQANAVYKDAGVGVAVPTGVILPLKQCAYEGSHYPCPNNSTRWLLLFFGSDSKYLKATALSGTALNRV